MTTEVKMKRVLIIGILLLLFSACDTINDIRDKQQLAQSIIKEKYGLETQIGFSTHNGRLTQVTLVLNSNAAKEKTVRELEEMTYEVASKVFKSTPKSIFIQIQRDK